MVRFVEVHRGRNTIHVKRFCFNEASSSSAWTVIPIFTNPFPSRIWCGRHSLSCSTERERQKKTTAWQRQDETKQKKKDQFFPPEKTKHHNLRTYVLALMIYLGVQAPHRALWPQLKEPYSDFIYLFIKVTSSKAAVKSDCKLYFRH